MSLSNRYLPRQSLVFKDGSQRLAERKYGGLKVQQVISAVLFPIKYAILLFVLEFAVYCRFMEGLAGFAAKNTKYVTGTNPIGASAVVRKSANGVIWLFNPIRKGLGRYVQKYHHVIYCHTEKLFR